ncbi:MAG: glutamine--fructose-6-phosphate aminotransferase, partial [Acidobacteriota bacterium]
MCGIVGYIGEREAVPLIVEGLEKLAYRGYDSAGVVVRKAGTLESVKAEGKLGQLVAKLAESTISGPYGLGHTRWATHGAPSERNAHPILDSHG